ncbi:MAG: dihydroneopterin aldolase [Roseovarius sp.]|nr:dihydroneopterin aldolase [Roseovarius sp.]
MDRISLRDYVIEADIGAFQSERGGRQRIRFNLAVDIKPPDMPMEDDVDRILSYDCLTEAISFGISTARHNLLETLAEQIAERILLEPQAMRAYVRIEKLDRVAGALGVEIARSSSGGSPLPDRKKPDETPAPLVVYLSNRAIGSPALAKFLDTCAEGENPVILCVGLPKTPVPHTGDELTQRRVNLLAIEQNAWNLAGRDGRCMVIGSRTELNWSIKHGRISVWAPSKIVLDSVETPANGPDDPIALAAWFSGLMRASRLEVIDDAAPGHSPVQVLVRELDDCGL